MRYSQYYPGSRPTIHLRQGPRNSNYSDITRLDFWKSSHRFLHCLVKYLEGIKYCAVFNLSIFLLNTEIFSLEPRSRNLSFIPETLTLSHQPANFPVIQSHPLPSQLHLLCSVYFLLLQKSRQYPEWGLPWIIRISTLVSHTFTWNAKFHTPVFHRLLWKAVVLSRTNIRSNQKNILK